MSVDLTEKDKQVILDVFDFFYKNGGIRSRQMVADTDSVIGKLLRREPQEVKDEPAKAAATAGAVKE